MTARRVLDIGITALSTLALTLLLSTSYLLDGADHSAEWAESTDLQAAQAQAAQAARRQAAAQALCTHERGPQSEARWTEDGELVCTTRRGARPLQVAGGAL